MAKIGRRQLARELVRLLDQVPAKRAETIRMVAAYLIATKRAQQAHLLMQDVADELYVHKRHIVADVYQAVPSDGEITAMVTNLLRRATGAQEIEVRQHVQPDLIGGIVIRTPRLELDASVRSQLKQIARGA